MTNNKAKYIIKAFARRIVPRKFIIWQGSLVAKNIALTFDDGPNPNYTEKVLDLLSYYKIQASFFILGKNLERYSDIGKRIIEDGHLLGNHTYSHKKSYEISIREFGEELDRTKGLIKKISGKDSNYFRPPFGILSFLKLWYCISKHFTTVQWSVDSKDFEYKGVQHILDNVLGNGIRGGNIVLLHDDNQFTADALPKIIEHLKRRAFEFVTVEDFIR